MLPFLLWLITVQSQVAGPAPLKSRSELVVLNVTVVDGESKPVAGLPREAFAVFEDNRPQPLGFFESSDSPATVGLVIDNSTSMLRRRQALVAAGVSFAAAAHPEDELFTINFNENVWPGLPAGRHFTSDREELARALQTMQTRGMTAFHDGLLAALRHLGHGQRQKKALVVISDGGDNASRSTFDTVLEEALRMDAVIYTISIYDEYDEEGRPELLRKLAAASGGEAFFLRGVKGIEETFARIARDIRSGYVLGYTPEPGAPGFRAVKVRVQPPDNRRLVVRCRSGYKR
jgi:VWFA-related protein